MLHFLVLTLSFLFTPIGSEIAADADLEQKTILVEGTVMTKGKPIAGVNIICSETKTYSRTDENGYYKITVNPGVDIVFIDSGQVIHRTSIQDSSKSIVEYNVVLQEDSSNYVWCASSYYPPNCDKDIRVLKAMKDSSGAVLHGPNERYVRKKKPAKL